MLVQIKVLQTGVKQTHFPVPRRGDHGMRKAAPAAMANHINSIKNICSGLLKCSVAVWVDLQTREEGYRNNTSMWGKRVMPLWLDSVLVPAQLKLEDLSGWLHKSSKWRLAPFTVTALRSLERRPHHSQTRGNTRSAIMSVSYTYTLETHWAAADKLIWG